MNRNIVQWPILHVQKFHATPLGGVGAGARGGGGGGSCIGKGTKSFSSVPLCLKQFDYKACKKYDNCAQKFIFISRKR